MFLQGMLSGLRNFLKQDENKKSVSETGNLGFAVTAVFALLTVINKTKHLISRSSSLRL